jgi:flagellar hook protein FlgE
MAFQQGLSGLNAASKNLDVIGNNVANANTVGFKQSRAEFADMFANSLSGGGGGTQAGIGVKVAAVAQQFGQGSVTVSNNPLDIAINGAGFYRLSDQGSISYSRNGQFHPDKEGYIVSSNGLRLTGYSADASGLINSGSPSDLRISTADLAPSTTSLVNALFNLDSRETALSPAAFDPTDPATYHSSTSVPIYDSLGNETDLSTYFVKTAANSWDVFAANDGNMLNGGTAIGSLNFLSNGSLNPSSPSVFSITSPVTTGANPLAFDVDFGGTTQFGSQFGVNTLTQDGFTSGRLTGYSVGQDGIISGGYSNGEFLALGQVVMANFANPQGLEVRGNNLWQESSASGAALVGTPGSSSLGVLQAGAVEESNVELTTELVNMITAQRIYQANAQTIKTQDQILQTMVNLR